MGEWNRVDIKEAGKKDFRKSYWYCVLISLVLAFCIGDSTSHGSSGATSSWTSKQSYSTFYSSSGEFKPEYAVIITILLFLILGLMIFSLVFGLLIGGPLVVGGTRFYLENQEKDTTLGTLFYGFKNGHYGNCVLTMFLKKLYIFLWSLLFIIPGIIKTYSYFMVPYILAENPTISSSRAFEISKQTMNGQKWDTFVFHLSFILWYLLGAFTCGLLGLFYITPYVDASSARLYQELKQIALQNNFATADELPGCDRTMDM